MKFAVQKGADIDNIEDLRQFLTKQMEDAKRTQNTPIQGGGDLKYQKHGKPGIMKVADFT